MDSNYQVQQQNHQPSSSGLLRFRSAPSSFLANLLPSSAAVEESERLISRFVSYGGADNSTTNEADLLENKKPSSSSSKGPSLMNSHGYGAAGLPPHYPRHGGGSAVDGGSFCGLVGGSMGSMDQEEATTTAHNKSFGSSNLLRQSSSPAGLFNNISFHNGFSTMKGVANFGGGVNGSNGELNPSINRLKNQISFSSRSASSLGMLSQISEIEGEDIEASSPDDGRQGGSNNGFPSYVSWNDTPQLSQNLSGLKRGRSGNENMFSDDVQNGDIGSQVNLLTHHLSLPTKSSAEMVAMEKLLQFPDSVPCKIRAKRGCATHPRSIAERVRRTRISERMRKLQELVPNMDKQTNTADMLDLAVEYIKDLQRQFKNLSEKRAKCKCISLQKTDTNQIA